MYDDLLSEMRDPVIFNTLHAFLQKSQVLVEQKVSTNKDYLSITSNLFLNRVVFEQVWKTLV